MGELTDNILQSLAKLDTASYYGRVSGVQGLFIEVSGILSPLAVGDRCNVINNRGKKVACEIVSFKDDKILLMPYDSMDGIGVNCPVEVLDAKPVIYPHPSWLGRIVNAFGEAIDGKGPLLKGAKPYFIKSSPPPAQFRDRVKGKVDLGIKAVNAFLTICKGQRMGIFAGSGVGKSTLMSMMARHTNSDISVIGLIGERGREVREFIENDIGPEGRKKSVLVVSTSDRSSMERLKAAYTSTAIAEYFRDMGYDVAVIADSTSRWAEALREMSGRLEEMPGEEGYPAYLGSRLAEFYERAGHVVSLGKEGREGSLSVIGAVSPPGGDTSEPVSQATLRIVKVFWGLDSNLAYKRHFPAINWLTSYSLYLDNVSGWFNTQVAPDWMEDRQKMMSLLQDEAELEEIVQMVGMDALSPQDRLKMEAARSIREDFLHQNSFHEVDTYTPLRKQYLMMKLVLAFYEQSMEALNKGASMKILLGMAVREKIGRYKYTEVANIEDEYEKIMNELSAEIAGAFGKEDF